MDYSKKTISQLKKIAQRHVNAFVRNRDADLPCISCGRYVENKDAGHYISVRQCDAMRYDVDNIFGQCGGCNRFMDGNVVSYRLGLVKRHGEDFVRDIETRYQDHKKTLNKWDKSRLIEIIQKYK